MDELIDDTANCFVPEMLVDYIDKHLQQGKGGIEPASFFLNGVCLLVDISGFTKLSGEFCNLGKGGIDELQLATNGYMGKLVEIIYTYGGEIIKFAGDAIICIFSSNFITAVEIKKKNGKLRRSVYDFQSVNMEDIINNINNIHKTTSTDSSNINEQNLKNPINLTTLPLKFPQLTPVKSKETLNIPSEVVLRSMICANILKNISTEKLTVHVAMSCGEMCFGILGGIENRWECLISGPCIHQLAECLDDAPSRTAVLSPECEDILKQTTTTSTTINSTGGVYNSTTTTTTDTAAGIDYTTIGGCDSSSTIDYSSSSSSIDQHHYQQQQHQQLVLQQHNNNNDNNTNKIQKSTIHTDNNGIYTFTLEQLPSGNHRIIDITHITHTTTTANHTTATSSNATTIKRCNPELSKIIRQFVPLPIADGLDSSAGLQYLAEIREVTTMFMKVSS